MEVWLRGHKSFVGSIPDRFPRDTIVRVEGQCIHQNLDMEALQNDTNRNSSSCSGGAAVASTRAIVH